MAAVFTGLDQIEASANSAVLYIPRLRLPGMASIIVANANTRCTHDHTILGTIQDRIRAH